MFILYAHLDFVRRLQLSFFFTNFPDGLDDTRMYTLARRHNALVLSERTAETKVEGLPERIRNDASRFVNKKRSRGVIL